MNVEINLEIFFIITIFKHYILFKDRSAQTKILLKIYRLIISFTTATIIIIIGKQDIFEQFI